MERIVFKNGMVLYGTPFIFSYRVFRQYRNPVYTSALKAISVCLAIPMFLDRDAGWWLSLWAWFEGLT